MRDEASNSTIRKQLDEANPHSVVAMVEGDAFKNAVKKVPDSLFQMEEAEIRELAKPTRTDYALRTALWNEIRLASTNGQQIKPMRIYSGICTYAHWWQNVLNCPAKLAWLLQPLKEYENALEPLLTRITERYHELLSLNIYDAKGRPIPSLARIVLDTAKTVEARIMGDTTQRLETRNLNVSLKPFTNSSKDITEMSMTEIEARLDELRNKNRDG